MQRTLSIKSLSKKELGYLLGFYLGDGYSNYSKNDRHYKTTFTLHSREKEAINYLKRILIKLGLNPFIVKDKRFNSIMLSVNSKIFMEYIKQQESEFFSGLIVNRDFCIGIISGFIDSEGYVNNGEIQLTQKNKKTLDRIVSLVKLVGIETRKFWSEQNYKSSYKIWRLRISTSFKYLSHNSLKVRNYYSEENHSVS